MDEAADTFDSAFAKAVDLGNRLAGKDKEADLWDIADGLLAGAVQYWLYSRQPCGDPSCEDCAPISTADARLAELKRLIDQLAAESEYFHAPTDANAETAASGNGEIGEGEALEVATPAPERAPDEGATQPAQDVEAQSADDTHDLPQGSDPTDRRHQTIFVSATISAEIERLSRQYMREPVEKLVAPGADDKPTV